MRDYERSIRTTARGDDLKQLVAAAHQRGMKVFIDIVANHTAWDSVLIAKHADWYTHDAAGQIVPPNPDWVDVADLDYSKPGAAPIHERHDGALAARLRLDGFRCDYAAACPPTSGKRVRPELDACAPGLALLAESDDPALLPAPSTSTTPGTSTTR